MTGAGAVVALVLLEWASGWMAAAAWTQSWNVVKRGHFRITAWITAGLCVLTLLAHRSSVWPVPEGYRIQPVLIGGLLAAGVLYLLVQYVRGDRPGALVGGLAGGIGVAALVASAGMLGGWDQAVAAIGLVAGAMLLGAVTNGMMLGHWYLNQPGLQPSALYRLTQLALVSVALSVGFGLVWGGRLSDAETSGAVLGLPGFGENFGTVFYFVWLGFIAFTGVVVWMARRCILVRSIQSATGLYYVGLLTAGIAEFLLLYLMVNT